MTNEPVRGGFPEPGFFSLSGLEQVRALQRGLALRPPLSHLVGAALTQVGPGSATLTMPASPWLADPGGTIQLSVLIERALYLAALTGAAAGTDVSTAVLSTNYLRPATTESGSFVARARVVSSGRTYTLAEVVVEDASGRAVAQSSASLLTRSMDPPPPPLAAALEPVAEPVYPTPDPYLRPDPGVVNRVECLSLLRSMIAGEFPPPPALQLFDARFGEVEEGRASVSLRTSEWMCGSTRVVAPGVLAYLAVTGLTAAIVTTFPPEHTTGILNVNFSFLRPVVPDGRDLLVRAVVVHQSSGLLVSTAEITDADGNRVALGQETAVSRPPRPGSAAGLQRALLTVLFTDIVGSTQRAETLGDEAWRALLAGHDALVRKQLELFKGREVKSTGDGFLAIFDSPARAIQCARAVRDGVKGLGIEIRASLHTGECEVVGTDVAGIAVHVAARLLSLAEPTEIMVSGTVHDLVAGSGIRFRDRGLQELKGIEGKRQVFAVEG